MTLEELKEQLAIDKSVLDDEVIRQPVLFYAVSELLTSALAERDGAKEHMNSVDAELSAKWRAQLTTTNQGRVTDTMVASQVQVDTKHKKAVEEYLDLKAYADQVEALKSAFQQRSYMLRDLVSLYTANYFEDSSVRLTKAQEASHHSANRARISIARAARGK